jgi:hypothetical protein
MNPGQLPLSPEVKITTPRSVASSALPPRPQKILNYNLCRPAGQVLTKTANGMNYSDPLLRQIAPKMAIRE